MKLSDEYVKSKYSRDNEKKIYLSLVKSISIPIMIAIVYSNSEDETTLTTITATKKGSHNINEKNPTMLEETNSKSSNIKITFS